MTCARLTSRTSASKSWASKLEEEETDASRCFASVSVRPSVVTFIYPIKGFISSINGEVVER